MDENMQGMMQEMAEMMTQMQDMMTQMQDKMQEMMGGEDMIAKKQKDNYLAKPESDRMKIDRKKVMGKDMATMGEE